MRINPASLRALRQSYGWSVPKFAKAVGISGPHLSNVENGKREASPELIRRMADILGVPLAALTSSYLPEEVA